MGKLRNSLWRKILKNLFKKVSFLIEETICNVEMVLWFKFISLDYPCPIRVFMDLDVFKCKLVVLRIGYRKMIVCLY